MISLEVDEVLKEKIILWKERKGKFVKIQITDSSGTTYIKSGFAKAIIGDLLILKEKHSETTQDILIKEIDKALKVAEYDQNHKREA